MDVYDSYDVVVVGHGLGGLSAGLSAREHGAETVVLEKAPREEAGGNTQYTIGLRTVLTELDPAKYDTNRIENAVPYGEAEFYEDMMRMSDGLADEELSRTLVEHSKETTDWLNDHGIEWMDGMYRPFYPGIEDPEAPGVLWLEGGGSAAVETLQAAGEQLGVDFHYSTGASDLIRDDDGRIAGVRAYKHGEPIEYRAPAVIIAAGGFEAGRDKQAKYLGEDQDLLTIRGTPYNTGEILEAGLDVGAKGEGHWSDVHATLVDIESDYEGANGKTNVLGYNYGILVNTEGERFIDEASERFEYGYVLMKELHEQPNRMGYIIADSDVVDLVDSLGPTDPEPYDTIEAMAEDLDIEPEVLVETVEEYNDAVQPGEFTPERPDGKSTAGLEPPKSNWAVEIDNPPFYVLPTKTGITFTFGGLKIDPRARVQDTQHETIPGLYAVGNSTGGFFFLNYAGGCGLAHASVFGRIAGEDAANYAG